MNFQQTYAISDRALTIVCSEIISEQAHQQVMQLRNLLEAAPFEGFIESVPAYGSLTVYFNPPATLASVETLMKASLDSVTYVNASDPSEILVPTHIIPVCYDDEYAPDWQEVSEQTGLTSNEIIAMHTAMVFRVYMIGFVPGFAYMGILPEALQTSRRKVPRLKVPSGSVAIAGRQTGIYPADIPGGWNLIGRTPVKLFDKHKEPCSFLCSGDIVQFRAISKNAFETFA